MSRTKLDQVQKLLDKSDSQVDSENVDSVVLNLGTNDVTPYRNVTELIIVNVTTCVENVKQKYPNANIGVCSILPRRGKGTHIQALISVENDYKAYMFNVLALNCCGLKNKLQYPEFQERLSANDILCLVESKTDDTDETLLPGYIFKMNKMLHATSC